MRAATYQLFPVAQQLRVKNNKTFVCADTLFLKDFLRSRMTDEMRDEKVNKTTPSKNKMFFDVPGKAEAIFQAFAAIEKEGPFPPFHSVTLHLLRPQTS